MNCYDRILGKMINIPLSGDKMSDLLTILNKLESPGTFSARGIMNFS